MNAMNGEKVIVEESHTYDGGLNQQDKVQNLLARL